MKYIPILLFILLVLINRVNIRKYKQNKETKHKQDLIQIESENVGKPYDLSNNVGIISTLEIVVNALTNQDRIEKAKSKERNAIHNALKNIKETLDQTPQKEINFADLFSNDGSSPDMGKQALIEDSPSPPMVYIQQDDNLDYVRAIDKLDLLDENDQSQELSLLEMSQFESRFQQTETPLMEQVQNWNLETTYEKTPGQSELSSEELQRQTEQMVDSLRGELENEDIQTYKYNKQIYIMKKHFNYDISFEQLNGRMPPTNTPCDKQPIIQFDSNVHIFWPSDQKFYSTLELKNFVQQDFFNHPLVQHLKPLIHRKPIQKQYLIRQYEDPLIMDKKREILKNLSWFASIKNNSNEFAKTLKFRLNQLSQQNYNQISKIIIELLIQKQKDEVITFIEELINIAANQNKFRQLYSQLMKEIIKHTNSYQILDSYLNTFIFYQENYEDYQNTYNKDDEIIVLTKRKQNLIGKYKFIVHLYKDRVIKIQYINNSIIQLQNRLIYLLENKHLQPFFTDEIVESLLDIILAMKNDLFIKQYKEDTQLEQDYLLFLKQKEYTLWNKDQFCFSQKGIRILLCWIEKRVISQRLKLLIANLLEKIDNNWKNKKQNSKKKVDNNSESSDSDIEELLPLKQKPSIKLNVQNLDLINEEENDFSVQKQPTIKQIHSNLERIFLIKQVQDYYKEILKLYSSIKQSELIISFWNCYLKLIARITYDNTQKVEYVYKIYSKTNEDFIKELILQQIQIRLSEVIYDVIDSKFGFNFIINMVKPYIEQDIKQIQLFLQIEINEETQHFFVQIIPKLVSVQNIQTVENIEFLQNFLIANLLLNKDQYRKVMDNIK